jgi:hypothetical protein
VLNNHEKRLRPSQLIAPPPPLPKLNKGKAPIRASALVERREQEARAALERAINRREQTIVRLGKLHAQITKLARQVQRYEKLKPLGS